METNYPIGAKVYPIDNSFLKKLSGDVTFNPSPRLAGSTVPREEPKLCTVLCNPYYEEVDFIGHKRVLEFVNVIYDNHTYRVLNNLSDKLPPYQPLYGYL